MSEDLSDLPPLEDASFTDRVLRRAHIRTGRNPLVTRAGLAVVTVALLVVASLVSAVGLGLVVVAAITWAIVGFGDR